MAGGDRFDLDVDVGDGAALTVTTAAAEKIYRALGAGADDRRRSSRSRPARSLAWLPQETILFDRARLARTHRRRSRGRCARCCWPRPSCSAARPWARRSTQGALSRPLARAARRRAGLRRDRAARRRDRASSLAAPAVAERRHRASRPCSIGAGRRGARRARARAAGQFGGEVGVSAWNGIAVARLCAARRRGAAARPGRMLLDGAARRRCRGSG